MPLPFKSSRIEARIMLDVPDSGVVKTAKSLNWIENGILFSLPINKAYLDIDEAKAITKAFQKLSPVPLPLFVDLHTITGQSSETREYFSSDPVHITTYAAVALFVSNPVARVIANIFMGLVKPAHPTKLFTDYDQALEWLSQYK